MSRRTKSSMLKDLSRDYAKAQETYRLVVGAEGKITWRNTLKKIEKEALEYEITKEELEKEVERKKK